MKRGQFFGWDYLDSAFFRPWADTLDVMPEERKPLRFVMHGHIRGDNDDAN